MASWTLPPGTLETVWGCLYPKLVGAVWAGRMDDRLIRPGGEVGLKWYFNQKLSPDHQLPPGIGLHVLPGLRTRLFVHQRGIALPYPEAPTSADAAFIFQEYEEHLLDSDVLLPGAFAGYVRVNGLSTAARAKFHDGIPAPSPRNFNDREEDVFVRNLRRRLGGAEVGWKVFSPQFSVLRTYVVLTIARMWREEAAGNASPMSYLKRVVSALSGEKPGGFSSEFLETIHVLPASNPASNPDSPNALTRQRGGVFSSDGYGIIPMPPRPSMDQIFKDWADGKADIPTFSPCPETNSCRFVADDVPALPSEVDRAVDEGLKEVEALNARGEPVRTQPQEDAPDQPDKSSTRTKRRPR